MAHEIGLLDKVVTDSSTDRAWHNQDTQLDMNNLDQSQFIVKSPFNFRVDCVELQRADTLAMIKGKFGVFCEGVDEIKQIVSARFDPIPPQSFGELGYKTAKVLNGKLVSAATLRNRSLGAISIDLGNKIELPGGDTIKQYVTLTISWDGTYKVGAVNVDWRTVCANTYPSPECPTMLEVKHDGSKFNPDELANQILEVHQNRMAASKQMYQDVVGNLVKTPMFQVHNKDLNRFAAIMADGKAVLDRIIKMDSAANGKSFLEKCLVATIDKEAWAKVQTSGMSNNANRIVAETLDGVGADLESTRGTLWGALNGYTYWADHLSGNQTGRGRHSTDETRQENVLFGGFNQEKQNAMLLLSAIANTPAMR